MKKFLMSAFALVMISPIVADADTIYADRAIFEAQLFDLIVDDYSDPDYTSGDKFDESTFDVHTNDNMSAIVGETTYTTTGFNDNNIIAGQSQGDPYYCAGCNGSFLLGFSTTSVGTTAGVFGVGFDFSSTDEQVSYVAFITFGDGSTQNAALDFTGFNTESFFGITSDLLISSIHVGLPDGGVTQSGSFRIDNLTIGSSAAVPEPGTLALLGAGLIGMGFARRRKKA